MTDNNAIQDVSVSETVLGFGTHDVFFTASDRAGQSTFCKTTVSVIENGALNVAQQVTLLILCPSRAPG